MDTNTQPGTSLPSNRQAEAALLATCLLHPKQATKVMDALTPDDFYLESHKNGWRAMQELSAEGVTINSVSFTDKLQQHQWLDDFSAWNAAATKGHAAIAALMASDRANVRDIDSLVLMIKNTATKRRLFHSLQGNIEPTLNGKPGRELIAKMRAELNEIERLAGYDDGAMLDAKQAAQVAVNAANKAMSGQDEAIKTGIVDLDRILMGLRRQRTYMVGGRPGDGKSSLLLSMVIGALDQGKRGALFTLEMTEEEAVNRLLVQKAGISASNLILGKLTPDEYTEYYRAVEWLESKQFYVNEKPAISVNDVRTICRRMKSGSGIDFIMIDYLQIMTPDRYRESRVLELTEITRGLKLLARELNVVIVAACQMNRASEQRANKEPQLSDLRESGSLENDADVVLLLHRPDQDKKQNVVLKVAKSRYGQTGDINLFFNESTTRFCNAARPA